MHQGLRWPHHHERVKINDIANLSRWETQVTYSLSLFWNVFLFRGDFKTETCTNLLCVSVMDKKMASEELGGCELGLEKDSTTKKENN